MRRGAFANLMGDWGPDRRGLLERQRSSGAEHGPHHDDNLKLSRADDDGRADDNDDNDVTDDGRYHGRAIDTDVVL
jgi:hypothetical protein